MGITFRYGGYHQFVRFGHRTIKDGEAAAIWNCKGVHTAIQGPKRILLWYSTIRFMDRFKAESHQYLQVKNRDGSIENVKGPISMHLNPCYHDQITVKDAIALKRNQVILVYYNNNDATATAANNNNNNNHTKMMTKNEEEESLLLPIVSTSESVRIVEGPTMFFPDVNDTIGTFHWTIFPHELSLSAVGNASVERIDLIQLHTPTIWRVRVPIGTSSAVKGYVTLGITYRIVSIEKATSHDDPKDSLISALMSDALAGSEAFTEDDFKGGDQSSTKKKLNEFSYKALQETAESCGFSIDLIEILDISPSDKVYKDMQRDNSIALELQKKIVQKEHAVRLRELEFEDSKAALRNAEEMAKNKADMKAQIDKYSYEQRMAALDRANEIAKKEADAKFEAAARSDAQVLEFLKGLKDLGANVTDVICSNKKQGSGRPIPALENVLGRVAILIENDPVKASSSSEKKETQQADADWPVAFAVDK